MIAAVGLALGGLAGVAVAAKPAPVRLAFTPSPYSFGSITVGNNAPQTFTLANTGGKAARGVTVDLAGSGAFSITADACSALKQLRAGKSCTVTVQFAPTSAGAASATLSAVNRKGAVLASVALTGTGAAAVPHLYWTDSGDGKIMRSNLDGTGVTTLVTGQADPRGVAVDASHIYWTNFGTATIDGAVMRANLDGTGVTTLASGQTSAIGVAVDAGHIYWAVADRVIKATWTAQGHSLCFP